MVADLELAVNEATVLPGPEDRLGGSFLVALLVEEIEVSEAWALKSMKLRSSL